MTAQPNSASVNLSKREVRKARRAARPAPTEDQQMFALMGGYFAGIVFFIGAASLFIMNAPA